MLTRDEQAKVFAAARAMRINDANRRRMVERNEMSPKRYEELKGQDEDNMKDMLKEVG